ncbi:MAG: choice-of-anchor tandem repeat GloVer-containing protein [Bacteroidia bacterium]
MKKIVILICCVILCVVSFTASAQTIGNLWGMTTESGDSGGGTMFGFNPVTGNDSIIVPFSGPTGSYPYYNNNIIQTSGGTFYGITYYGGTNDYGTIFKRTAYGKATVLHNFNKDGNDGYYPYGSIMMASDGMLYGMTYYGGANGYGIIFKCDTLGNYRVIHNFAGGATDGEYPYIGGLTQAANGTLFGMTYDGGTNSEGTIFKCDTAGNLTVIYSFGTNANDGYYPYNSLLLELTE